MQVNPLGNIFQNVLNNGAVGNLLTQAGGGGGLGGLAETGVELLHTHSPLGKVGATLAENTSGGVLNAEGLGDAAGVVVDFYSGNWFGAAAGAKDLLENFANFDVSKLGHAGLLNLIDPSGNLKNKLPLPPGVRLADKLLQSDLGKTFVQGPLRLLGNLAKALPDPGEGLSGLLGGGGLLGGLLGGGKEKTKAVGKLTKDVGNLQNMFGLLDKTSDMGKGVQGILSSLLKG